MRLLIISHTPHYLKQNTIVGWGPTVREIDHLCQLFRKVVHVAPLHRGVAPASSAPYTAGNVEVRSVAPASSKLELIYRLPGYVKVIAQEAGRADVVHVRCPANISAIGIVLLSFLRKPAIRWIKYAGNWRPERKDSWGYNFQRWWLRHRFHRGFVTVNGDWLGDPGHVHPFLNPCLTNEELALAKQAGTKKELNEPLRILFVGRLEQPKGVSRVLHIVERLQQEGVEVFLDLVGDGPQRSQFERSAAKLGLSELVKFHGWVPRSDLPALYGSAHFLLLPTSSSEGWPKVLGEAMAYGVVPVSTNVSSIPQYLRRFETGRTFEPENLEGFVGAFRWYAAHPEIWKQETIRGMKAAHGFTYDAYLTQVRSLIRLPSVDPREETARKNTSSI